MTAAPPAPGAPSAFRVRLGFGLIAVSWLPIAQAWIWIASLSGAAADELRAAVWTVQILMGFVGIAVAGRETVRVAKSVGWRRMPRAVWELVRPARAEGVA